MHELVGSFFNRHAVAVALRYAPCSHAEQMRNARGMSRNTYHHLSMISLFHIVLRKFRVVLRGCTKCNVGNRSDSFVDVRFQIYFTPLSGVLFTFPSRYLFTIDLQKYLALPVSSGGFPELFVSRGTQGYNKRDRSIFTYGIITLWDAAFQPLWLILCFVTLLVRRHNLTTTSATRLIAIVLF